MSTSVGMKYYIARVQVSKDNISWMAIVRRRDNEDYVEIFADERIIRTSIKELHFYEQYGQVSLTAGIVQRGGKDNKPAGIQAYD